MAQSGFPGASVRAGSSGDPAATGGGWSALADLVAPPTCMLCGRVRTHLCHECASELREPPAVALPAGVDRLVVLCAYEDAGSRLVLALKRRNRRGAVPLLGAALAEAVRSGVAAAPAAAPGMSPTAPPAATAVTWAPTTPARRRERGFDQSQLIARSLATALGLPCRRLLRRRSREVMGATRAERLHRVAFGVAGRVAPHVVLVDDVVTTGATMSAAASALRSAGASWVTGVALARARPAAVPQS